MNMFPASCLALSPFKSSEGENDCYLCAKDNIKASHLNSCHHLSKLKVFVSLIRMFNLLKLDAFDQNLLAGTYLFMLKYMLANMPMKTTALEGKSTFYISSFIKAMT